MVTLIWSVTDNFFCHFGLIFALLFSINPKNQNFKNLKKMPGDIMIIHMCTKNYDHLMYSSWDMMWNE